ncbi:MAG TPA: hypothetical protein VFO79_07375 [Xanthomonadales bacterium]|nr:hypothetical protein [Xanthomonadales bacterium]
MNAAEALKHAATCGSEAMLHARTIAQRRDATGKQLATWHPAAVIAAGVAAGALFGRIVANHPKLTGASAFAMTLLRAAPAETLWRMWGGGSEPPP